MTHETDPLSSDRIEQMRTNVMDHARTSRRSKRLVPVLAAASIVGVLGFAGIGQLATGETQVQFQKSSIAGATMADDSQGSAGISDRMVAGDELMSDTDSKSMSSVAMESDFEDVITTALVSITVKDPSATAKKVASKTKALDGHVSFEDFSMSANGVHLTVRVPSASVDEFLEFTQGLGKVTESSRSGVNVGQQARDLDARIESLHVSTERLRSIMKEAKNTRDLLDAETQLAARQGELESLQAQRKALRDQTSLATIDVYLGSEDSATTVNPGGFRGGLIAGWNALVNIVDAAVAGIGFVLPWLVPLGLVAMLGRWFIRRRRR